MTIDPSSSFASQSDHTLTNNICPEPPVTHPLAAVAGVTAEAAPTVPRFLNCHPVGTTMGSKPPVQQEVGLLTNGCRMGNQARVHVKRGTTGNSFHSA